MNVLIVESAAKARTLGRYLGSGWKVLATGGHVQTLPYDRSRHGKDAKKAYWANRSGELPSPPWAWTERGEEAVRKILAEADADATFWIATDPDREGEFIAWRLKELLEGHGRVHRVSFQEVTEEAVQGAIEAPGEVDGRLVESAQVRMFLDRLVGFRGARMAKGVLGGTAPMGRVQTPTLGFVVERELEREAHVPIPYFEVGARAAGIDLEVRFHEPGDEAMWKDNAGKPDPTRTFDRELATAAERAIREAGSVRVTEVDPGKGTTNPRAPFSTDALLQAAGTRFGWSPRKTSALASMLYQEGHLTYIRTDSTRLAASAIAAIRRVVEEAFGRDHLGKGGTAAAAPAKGGPVQDAHEAIRPTRFDAEEAPVEDEDARRLYRLVRAHTLASQMAPARYETVKIRASAEGLDRPLAGNARWRTFPGWEAAYAEFRSEPATRPPGASLEAGAIWPLDPEDDEVPNPRLVEDETRPPGRFRRHSLIKAMKDEGIGRPSTYATTVEKLEDRKYVVEEDGALVPTERGRALWLDVAPLYVRDGSETELFSAEFTSLMERGLDAVARGEDVSAETWERWRDEVRELHEIAQQRRTEGRITPRTRDMLERLRATAPEGTTGPDDLDALSEKEGREWIERLREAGAKPAPTEKQMAYLKRLVEELDANLTDPLDGIGLDDLSTVRTSEQASALIEDLKALHDELRPPTRKQLGLIERLREELGLDEAEAAALVGEDDLDRLTGGREGSASALIDQLLEMRAEDGKKDKAPPTS